MRPTPKDGSITLGVKFLQPTTSHAEAPHLRCWGWPPAQIILPYRFSSTLAHLC